MNIFLILTFLFFLGAVLGWVLELLFRRFFSSANPERKWINPGFLVGPYVPLYGFGLCLLYLLTSLKERHWISNPVCNELVFFVLMAFVLTAIEYLAGVFLLKFMKLRLWDYSRQWGNLNGLICPKFSLAWALLGTAYSYLVHPHILNALQWLSENLAFSFVIGVFFGVFLIDFVYSTQLAAKIKQFAKENDTVVRYEHLKLYLKGLRTKGKAHFFLALHTEQPLGNRLRQYYERMKERQEEFERTRGKKR